MKSLHPARALSIAIVLPLALAAMLVGARTEIAQAQAVERSTAQSIMFAGPAAVTLRSARAPEQPSAVEGVYKDPGIATIVSVVVPGGGQLYSGEMHRGLGILGVSLGSLLAGETLAVGTDSAAPLALGLIGYFGGWIYGIIDAGDSASRMNLKTGAKSR